MNRYTPHAVIPKCSCQILRYFLTTHSFVNFAYLWKENLIIFNQTGKGKAFPLQVWTGPLGSKRLRLTEFLDNRHMKVVTLSALRTGCLYPQE